VEAEGNEILDEDGVEASVVDEVAAEVGGFDALDEREPDKND
jgi:hypothetical protein